LKINHLAKARWIPLLVVLLVFPLVLERSLTTLITEVLISGLYAMAFNLVLGYTGLMAFGHAAFWGIGAYTTALLITKASVPMLVGLIVAPIVAGIAGLFIAWFSVRLTGFFFAFITMGAAQVVWAIFYHWRWAGGADGIYGVSLMRIFYSPENFYYLTLGIVAVCSAILKLIINSPFGLTLQAVRDNPTRTEFVGLSFMRYKIASMAISAFFSGLAGGLMCLLNRCAYPELLYFTMSGDPLIMSLLGGVNFFFGPLVGAFVLVGLDKIVTNYTIYWPLTLGSVILFIVLFLPGGIVGFISKRRRLLEGITKRIF
jgi:branched-chain amino acid transport system permease protein